MSGLVSLWKKHQDRRRSALSSTQSNDSAGSHTSPLHRKIHPDLEALVAQSGDHHADDSTEPTALTSSTVPSALDFIPLEPRKARRPYSVPPHPRPLSFVAESQDILEQEEKQSTTISTASPAPGDVWSTFGRGRKLSHTPLDSLTSTPGASGIRDMRGNTQFRTPTSTSHSTEGSSSISRSTQTRSCGSPSIHNDMLLTAHRPEKHSSPSSSSYHTFGRHRSSPYVPTERPPPLPPLDHPAFQSLGYRKQASSSNIQHVVLPGKRPRRFASLPSLSIASPARLQTISGTSKYIRSTRRAHRKTSGPLHQIDDNAARVLHPIYQRNLTPTAANESRRSDHNSRRSSPEYSHEQAVIGIDAQESGGGEAQVSRQGFEPDDAFPEQDNNMSKLGNTRGDNASYRQVIRLGNPISLQDPYHHTLPQGGWHGDNHDLSSTHDITISGKGIAKANEMTQPDTSTHRRRNHGREKDTSLRDTRRNRDPTKSPNRLHSAASPRQDRISQSASKALLIPPSLSLTSPTPETTPVASFLPVQPLAQDSSSGSKFATPSAPALKPSISRTNGKRKADEVEVEAGTLSKDSRKEHRATFAPDKRPHRVSENSGSSNAPSSYRRKRARLSTSSDSRNLSRSPSIMSSLKENLNAANTGSWSSRASAKRQTLSTPHHQPSRQSMQSQRPSNQSQSQRPFRESRRVSLSGASIPISALVSPHAPSITPSAVFHMHDPRRPGPIQRTSWALSFPSRNTPGGSRWAFNGWVERGGSPIHSWLFFLGFLIFPIWWLAAFIGIPKTRRIGAGETEKGVVLDDPQVEHDAKTWRIRCRVMSVISFFTYIPFIILVAIFARP